jgi:predicted ribosome quality control (RQC) complex YloA/Tae2 family protein
VIVALPHPTTLDDTTLVEAATLAAYFSKSKDGSHVAVDYTPKKNVKKIPQAKPGMVIYQNFKTVYVTPTESLVKQLSR